jgi:hypothetical protein
VSEEDDRIRALGERLTRLKAALGSDYWGNAEVQEAQAALRRAIGEYGAWSADKPPMHQRARVAARYESAYAPLIWPGRGDD